jgi:hypothetical protein
MKGKGSVLLLALVFCFSVPANTHAQTPFNWNEIITYTNVLRDYGGKQFGGLVVKINLAVDFANEDADDPHDRYNRKTAAKILTGYMHQMDSFTRSGKLDIPNSPIPFKYVWIHTWRPWVKNVITWLEEHA